MTDCDCTYTAADIDTLVNDLQVSWAEVAELKRKLAKAVQHIEWFISEDETNRGDEPMPERWGKTWNEINAYWIEHLDSAIAFVAELKEDKR